MGEYCREDFVAHGTQRYHPWVSTMSAIEQFQGPQKSEISENLRKTKLFQKKQIKLQENIGFPQKSNQNLRKTKKNQMPPAKKPSGKKRGRKPKNVIVENKSEKKIPKKRGRKPKGGKIIKNINDQTKNQVLKKSNIKIKAKKHLLY